MVNLQQGDCLELMKDIPDKSVDMVFCDMPYGMTSCKWDSVINLESMWEILNRICKDNTAMVFTASQPFTSVLVCSNLRQFRCEWIYHKTSGSNFATVKYYPMKEHENVLVFSKNTPRYYPIKEERRGGGLSRVHRNFVSNNDNGIECYGGFKNQNAGKHYTDLRYPSSIQYFSNRAKKDRGLHPTQKPVALCEYFIKTYSKESDTVLDFCMGSGTTGVACINSNRSFIGIELEEKYFNIAKERIEKAEGNKNES